ncbi:MAG TPA: PilZ domain-containing protein [Stellaceae bacterium]|nr:PilZ domain-containing protein [Stellaceae bacterium]
MPDDQITDAKDLLKRVSDFGENLKERRRFERKQLFWAASVEVRGQRFEGMIVDLSPGGARMTFDAPVAAGDELTLVLKHLDELGAKVVWQREGEAGLQFLLAPEEVAAKLQQTLAPDLASAAAAMPALAAAAAPAPAAAAAPAPAVPRRAPPSAAAASRFRQRLLAIAATGVVGLGALISAGLLISDLLADEALPPGLVASVPDEHSCATLMDKVSTASNQLDFSLKVASAAQAKCLDIHHLGPTDNDTSGHMVRTTKVPDR